VENTFFKGSHKQTRPGEGAEEGKYRWESC
jgi:hypothetical protein